MKVILTFRQAIKRTRQDTKHDVLPSKLLRCSCLIDGAVESAQSLFSRNVYDNKQDFDCAFDQLVGIAKDEL